MSISENQIPYTLALSPEGRVYAAPMPSGEVYSAIPTSLVSLFIHNASAGLFALLITQEQIKQSSLLGFWYSFVDTYVGALYHSAYADIKVETSTLNKPVGLNHQALEPFVYGLPPMMGAEYISVTVLANLGQSLTSWLESEAARANLSLCEYLSQQVPQYQNMGRVYFHLAENKQDPDYPFAFMATYTSAGQAGQARHQPLHAALQEYAKAGDKVILQHLLKPIYAASQQCDWVRTLIENGDIYHPFLMTSQEAYTVLTTLPELESCGLHIRFPDWWKKRPRPQVKIAIGSSHKTTVGADALLDFRLQVVIGDMSLTREELANLLASDEQLIWLRGQWVEVDKEKLAEALAHWQVVEKNVQRDGLSFIEGMRLLAGASQTLTEEKIEEAGNRWAFVEAGPGLRAILQKIQQPSLIADTLDALPLRATLRPYQAVGVNWLYLLTELGLGACLADDMGLGKTIQVIALLLRRKHATSARNIPSLLVLPASLLGNWQSELQRFAPTLRFLCIHNSSLSLTEVDLLTTDPDALLASQDIVLTTYGKLVKQPQLLSYHWDLVILDEAQAIKNPTAQQTKAVKQLNSRSRIALTGTPVENRLGDLWSLFDFLCPGLLGTTTKFKSFVKSLEQRKSQPFAPLRQLVQPYILRRMKTDKAIIDDLPDKTEVLSFCGLSRAQIKLYNQAVTELTRALDSNMEGIKRQGLVLSFLMRFKQICNHPNQLLGYGDYHPHESGKFSQLKTLCEAIASRQEKVIIFTQFKEMTVPLADFLASVFGRKGLVLHGSTPVGERRKLVEQFQQEQGPPFFVLSLKAGGTGLNLTAANHVIHFDRWWNPAVENQATDRAFRIGQKKHVLVHKLVCQGTIEEKIAALINEKTVLANEILQTQGEAVLTTLDNNALIDLISLDIDKAQIE